MLLTLVGFECDSFTIQRVWKIVKMRGRAQADVSGLIFDEDIAQGLVDIRNMGLSPQDKACEVRYESRSLIVLVFKERGGNFFVELSNPSQMRVMETQTALDEFSRFEEKFIPSSVRRARGKYPTIGTDKPCPECGAGNMADDFDKLKCYTCGHEEPKEVMEPIPTSGLPRRPSSVGSGVFEALADELAKGGHPVSDKKREVSLDPPPSTDDPMGHVSQGKLDRLETEEPVSQQTASRITDADDLERFPND